MKEIKIATYLAGKNLSEETLQELCALSQKLQFNLLDHGVVSPKLEIVEKKEGENDQLDKWIVSNLDEGMNIFKISTTVPELDLSEGAKESQMSNEILNMSIVRDTFEKGVMDVVVVANIARIASLNIRDSMTVLGNYLRGRGNIPLISVDNLDFALEIVQEYEWPKLHELEFVKVWNWAHNDNEILDGFANKSRVARAVHAYSRLLEFTQTVDGAHDLMWALIGIEALYVKGKVSIMEQVREKIQTFLGKTDRNKKLIANMYDFRSRLIHGDLGFPAINFMDYFGKEFSNYSDEIVETISLAIAILIATIQEIVIRDCRGLDFSYRVEEIR